MKEPDDATCDRQGCECLATIDMTAIIPSPYCAECGKAHQITRVGIQLYLCELHAREIGLPATVFDLSMVEAVREVLAAEGFEDIELERAIWEFAPVPKHIALRAN